MKTINEIKKSALALGACGRISRVSSISEASSLLMTPQGREFALKTGYPDIDTWRSVSGSAEMSGALIDCGKTKVRDCDFIAAGESIVEASFRSRRQLYHILAMHGAEVRIVAGNYAVVNVTAINARVIVTDDGTAIVNVEQRGGGR